MSACTGIHTFDYSRNSWPSDTASKGIQTSTCAGTGLLCVGLDPVMLCLSAKGDYRYAT